jgi:hypothetical protein
MNKNQSDSKFTLQTNPSKDTLNLKTANPNNDSLQNPQDPKSEHYGGIVITQGMLDDISRINSTITHSHSNSTLLGFKNMFFKAQEGQGPNSPILDKNDKNLFPSPENFKTDANELEKENQSPSEFGGMKEVNCEKGKEEELSYVMKTPKTPHNLKLNLTQYICDNNSQKTLGKSEISFEKGKNENLAIGKKAKEGKRAVNKLKMGDLDYLKSPKYKNMLLSQNSELDLTSAEISNLFDENAGILKPSTAEGMMSFGIHKPNEQFEKENSKNKAIVEMLPKNDFSPLRQPVFTDDIEDKAQSELSEKFSLALKSKNSEKTAKSVHSLAKSRDEIVDFQGQNFSSLIPKSQTNEMKHLMGSLEYSKSNLDESKPQFGKKSEIQFEPNPEVEKIKQAYLRKDELLQIREQASMQCRLERDEQNGQIGLISFSDKEVKKKDEFVNDFLLNHKPKVVESVDEAQSIMNTGKKIPSVKGRSTTNSGIKQASIPERVSFGAFKQTETKNNTSPTKLSSLNQQKEKDC